MTENEIQELVELVYPFVDGTACEQESGSCEFTTCRDCNALNTAKTLYSKGYRKVERGEWKDKRCTKCGETMWYIARGNALATTFYQVKSKFCPHCGADMRGVEDEG